jgi:hypothetical protein
MKRVGITRRPLPRPPVPEHPLQKQIADALRLEIAPPGKVSRDGVVWWSVDHASYAGIAPGARIERGMVASVPDLFVLHRGIAHMIETKTPAGELSEPQQSVMSGCWRAVDGLVLCVMPTKCWGCSMHGAFPGRGAWRCVAVSRCEERANGEVGDCATTCRKCPSPHLRHVYMTRQNPRCAL